MSYSSLLKSRGWYDAIVYPTNDTLRGCSVVLGPTIFDMTSQPNRPWKQMRSRPKGNDVGRHSPEGVHVSCSGGGLQFVHEFIPPEWAPRGIISFKHPHPNIAALFTYMPLQR